MVTPPRGGVGRGGRGVWDLVTYLPGEALGRVVLCSSAVKSRSCVSGVQGCTCGLSQLLNKRNSSLAGVSAAVPTAPGRDIIGGTWVVMAKGALPGYRSSHRASIPGKQPIAGLACPNPSAKLLGRAGEMRRGGRGFPGLQPQLRSQTPWDLGVSLGLGQVSRC